MTTTGREADTAVHRALADERRVRIVAELDTARAGLDAAEIGRRVGLHPNTVRWHLHVLAGAGLVCSAPEARQRPGRPRVLYRLEHTEHAPPHEEYRPLATVLAELASASGSRACEEAGRSWARRLFPEVSEDDADDERAIGTIVRLLAEQGFEPTAAGHEIEMRHCPFHDLAETMPGVVCAVHRGLISGGLAQLQSKLAVSELEIFPRPGVCIAHLAEAA